MEWHTTSRDCYSPSKETCENCGLDVAPYESFPDELPVDKYGEPIFVTEKDRMGDEFWYED